MIQRLHSTGTRRAVLAAAVGLAALAGSGASRARANRPVVIGWLESTQPWDSLRDAFNEGMAALGWKHGTHYLLEERQTEGHPERLPALAREVAAKQPKVIVVVTSLAASAAAAAAPTTPIVVANGDPLSNGLVSSLARPGGLITGVSNVSPDAALKVIELLLESLPKLQRVGLLGDSTTRAGSANLFDARSAAERLGVEAVSAEVARPEDIEPAMARMAKEKAQALVILSSPWLSSYFTNIIRLAQAQRWPVAGNLRAVPVLGGLFGFGPDRSALARRSAHYVDRILKGAHPGDLPIEQPTTFYLVVNLKTAKELGIAIPPSVLVRATEVLE